MFAILHKFPSLTIGRLLGTDINIDLLSPARDARPNKDVVKGLKEHGYAGVLGTSAGPFLDSHFETDNPIKVRTIRLYDVEADWREIECAECLSTFGQKYILITTDLATPTYHLEDHVLFMKEKGYVPVLSRAECYECLQDNYRNLKRLARLDCLLQADMISLTGYHGLQAKRLAEKLFRDELVSFVGTGASNADEQEKLKALRYTKKLAKQLHSLKIRNRTLVLE